MKSFIVIFGSIFVLIIQSIPIILYLLTKNENEFAWYLVTVVVAAFWLLFLEDKWFDL